MCCLIITFIFDKGGTVLLLYSSPLVIISSVFLFLSFTKFSFHCRFVNWIAASSFAVYLVHTPPFIIHPYYIDLVSCWYKTEIRTTFLFKTLGLISFFFIFSIYFDQVRILLWKFTLRLFRQMWQKHGKN